jgi:hypothetical protein
MESWITIVGVVVTILTIVGFNGSALSKLRTEMNAGFATVRGEIVALRTETKEEFAAVRGEIATLRTETKEEFAAVRAEARSDSNAVRAEARSDTSDVRADIRALYSAIIRLAGSRLDPDEPRLVTLAEVARRPAG